MRYNITKTTLLALVAISFVSILPMLASNDSMSAEAQRRPTVRRRTPVASTVIVPSGTNLRVRLNNDLSSKDSRVGDRFTTTVVNPSRYENATVTGHISSIKKSGTVKGRTSMTLAFDAIEMPEGRRAPLRGQVVRIYDSESGKVDDEGRVESGSRGKQAIKRGGIGAAAGAIIGGIAGGGKGAAIGLILGGAGGAGSLAVQGSKELKLESGTEMLVRVTRR
ncbi:MAG TPA: hypothetical protein VLR90_16205 [Blastocatellia bacterium]|nr:hypothetical protein [Blastocatellia bacterium]